MCRGTEKANTSQKLVTGASVRGDEKRRKRFELRRESERPRTRSSGVKLPRKARWHVKPKLPVPETDTGREVENTKGREITLSKELGKMAP